MTKRRGMMVGSGKSGYFNVVPIDPKVHSDAGKGIRQPQRVGFDAKLLPAFKKEPEFTKIEASGADPDKKPSAFWSAVGKAEAFAAKTAKAGYAKGKKYLTEQQQKAEARRIAELKDVDHPHVKELEQAKENVTSLENQIDLNEDSAREEKLFQELDVAKAKRDTAEKKLKDIDLTAMSDEQLKTLAIRHTGDDSFLSIDSKNKYEREILRRIRARKQIDADIEAEQKKPLGKSDSSWSAFLNPSEDQKIFKSK